MRKIVSFIFLLVLSFRVFSAAELLYSFDAEDGTVGQKPPNPPLTAVTGPNIPLITDNPVYAGTKAYDVLLDRSQPTILGAQWNPYRTEMRGKTNIQMEFERSYWIGFAFRRTIWDTDTSSENFPIQIHEVPGDPVTGDGDWTNWGVGTCQQSAASTAPIVMISANNVMTVKNLSTSIWSKSVDLNTWHTVVFHVKWSKGSTGYVESWYDGVSQARKPASGTTQTHRADSAMDAFCGPDTVNKGDVVFVPSIFAAGAYKWDWKIGRPATLTTVRRGTIDNIKIAQDIAGNDDAGGFALANPNGGADTTPPVISSPTVNSTATSITWTWVTNEPATTRLNHDISGAQQPVIEDLTLTTNHSVTVNGLTPSTPIGYKYRSADAAGNVTIAPAGVASTLAETSLWSNITATSITATSANICGTASVARTFNVQYSTDLSYSSTAGNGATSATSQCKVITGLTPFTAYNYRLSGADTGGNTVVSGNNTFTTLSSLGTPVVTNTNNSVTVTWNSSSSNIGTGRIGLTNSYGTTVHETVSGTSHSVTFTGLTSNTLYHYQVGSLTDNIFTADATVTTSVSPPVISSVTYSTTKNTITVNWTTDQLSDTEVYWGKGKNIGNTPAYNATLVTSHSITLTSAAAPNDILPNSIYYIRPKSTNATGTVVFHPDILAVITQTKSGLRSYGFE